MILHLHASLDLATTLREALPVHPAVALARTLLLVQPRPSRWIDADLEEPGFRALVGDLLRDLGSVGVEVVDPTTEADCTRATLVKEGRTATLALRARPRRPTGRPALTLDLVGPAEDEPRLGPLFEVLLGSLSATLSVERVGRVRTQGLPRLPDGVDSALPWLLVAGAPGESAIPLDAGGYFDEATALDVGGGWFADSAGGVEGP